jgi:hypothetical protein
MYAPLALSWKQATSTRQRSRRVLRNTTMLVDLKSRLAAVTNQAIMMTPRTTRMPQGKPLVLLNAV